MNLRNKKLILDIPSLALFLCLFMTCSAGHPGVEWLTSICRYVLFALLILELIFKRAAMTRSLIIFFLLTFAATLINTVYNVFSGARHYDLISALRAFVYYCLYVYCGFYIAYTFWDSDKLYQWLHLITITATVIIFSQCTFSLFGIYLNRLPFVGTYLFDAVDTYIYFRPNAFFSEPSYFAEVAILDVYYCLFVKKKTKVATVELVAIALSTSSLGIVFGFGLLVWWAVFRQVSKNKLVNILLKVCLVAAFTAVLFFLFGYIGDNAIINRLMSGATIKQRTFRAFEIYGRLSLPDKVFGIGMQNLANYLNTYSIKLVNEGADTLLNREFAQSFGYVLCTLGIVGAAGFVYLIITSIYYLPKGKKVIGLMLFGLSLFASLITRQYFSLYLAVMFSTVLKENSDLISCNLIKGDINEFPKPAW